MFELKLQKIASHCVGGGNRTQVLWKSSEFSLVLAAFYSSCGGWGQHRAKAKPDTGIGSVLRAQAVRILTAVFARHCSALDRNSCRLTLRHAFQARRTRGWLSLCG